MESAKRYSWQRRAVNGLLFGMHGVGLDVGAGRTPFAWWELPELRARRIDRVDTWDKTNGDAHYLSRVADSSYDFVFASHILEHLESPATALGNWVRVVKPGGTLLIAVPHQMLYERKAELPSRWNPDHKRFYQPHQFCAWLRTMSVVIPFTVEAVQTGDWHNAPGGGHPVGEYQIDALLRKGDE